MLRYLIVLIVFITSIYAKAGWVVATGYGNTKDEALKSAFSDAVSQYIGVLVDSKTLTKNGKLIEDKILTFSNGYIEDYKILNASQRAGLWQVKIQALVKEQKLLNKIKQEKISIQNITNSRQRYARLVSQIKTKFDAEDIFVEKMKTLLSWDTLKRYNQPKITYFYIDEDGATRKYVPVKIVVKKTLNEYVYNSILDDLRHLFKQLGGKKVSKPINKFTSIKMCNKWRYDSYYGFNCKNYEYWQFPNSYKVIYPFINQEIVYGEGWFIFMKDGEDKTVVYSPRRFTKHYVINFLDKNGKVLKSFKNDISISPEYDDGIFWRYTYIKPFDYVNYTIFDKTIKVPLKAFKDLRRVEVKWVD